MFLLALFSSSAYAVCTLDQNNGAFYDMNPACNNAGRCALNSNGEEFCDCCNKYTAGKWDESSTGGYGCYGNPEWIWGAYFGDWCQEYQYYIYGKIKYLVETDGSLNDADWIGAENFKCHQTYDPTTLGDTRTSVPDIQPFTEEIMHNAGDYPDLVAQHYMAYPGNIRAWNSMFFDEEHLRHTCVPCGLPDECEMMIDGTKYTSNTVGHLLLTLMTDFNTYYDTSCIYSGFSAYGEIPSTYGASIGMYDDPNADPYCAGVAAIKFDNGYDAYYYFYHSAFGDDSGTAHLNQLNTNMNLDGVSVTHIMADWNPHGASLGQAIGIPTVAPTRTPTEEPTDGTIDCFSMGYTHHPDDFEFKGVSIPDCRGGLSPSWPGGQTCDSPYVICLPQENTPTADPETPIGFPMGIDGIMEYPSDTHRYSIEECKYACAFDQRCLGFEFVPDQDSALGDCNLIDDIPIEVSLLPEATLLTESDVTTAEANGNLYAGMGLDTNNPSGALCFALKDDYCNPYFHEHQLTDVMLNCYCPNNRKGFYTKKVQRTEAASRYCGTETDQEVTKRIRNAQANRMFHLCENWCLFNTETPRTESWYHDPWNGCWREQYAGVGTHRSYCFRVIRDPMTIEQFFIDTRAEMMCAVDSEGVAWTNTPTQAPVDPALVYSNGIRFFLAGEEESCDDACEQREMRCDGNVLEEFTNEWVASDVTNEQWMQTVFQMSGYECAGATVGGKEGWALPGMLASQSLCITRNETTTHTPCNLAIGVGYRRLCACTDVDGTTS